MDTRLPAHMEVAGLCRAVESAGGFAMVLQKGERDAGVILISTTDRGKNTRLWERMPQLNGSRRFVVAKVEESENPQDFAQYMDRRRRQDPDCWVVELDIADAERFIDSAAR